MGNSCGNYPKPDTTNICSDELGHEVNGKNFCTLAGSNDSERNNFCNSLGDDEWKKSGNGNSCYYNSCDERTKVESGCCNGCCGIAGQGVTCKRVAFNGNNLGCCFRDLKCNTTSDEQYCFTDSTKKLTCNPLYRDKSSFECKGELYDYCIGIGVSDTEFINRWIGNEVLIDGNIYDQPCYHALYRNIYAGQTSACLEIPGVGYTTAAGLVFAQDLLDQVFFRYTQGGGNLTALPGEEGNTQLNNMLWNICVNDPGLCERALYRYCSNVTTDTMIRRNNIKDWCGCYMPDNEYSKYTNLYQISKECTPTCNSTGVIKLANGNGTGVLNCKQSLCIIDEVTINIAQSEVGVDGSITFNQLCSGCQSGQCSCILSGLNLTIIDSTIGNIDISQECTGNASCYKEITDSEGNVIGTERIACETEPGEDPFKEIDDENKANQMKAIARRNWWIIFLFFILIFAIIMIWVIYTPYFPSETVKTYNIIR